MYIYQALVSLLPLVMPIMAFLAFPLSFGIASSLSVIVNAGEKEQRVAELKNVARMIAVLLLPFSFGMFTVTIIAITEKGRWISSSFLLTLYHFLSLVPFAFLPSVIILFRNIMGGQQKPTHWLGIWFGTLWALLYLSLLLLFYRFPI